MLPEYTNTPERRFTEMGREAWSRIKGWLNMDLTYAEGERTVLTEDEQRCELLQFTGELKADHLIEFAPTTGLWFVSNETGGAFSLRVGVTGNPNSHLPLPLDRRVVICFVGDQLMISTER